MRKLLVLVTVVDWFLPDRILGTSEPVKEGQLWTSYHTDLIKEREAPKQEHLELELSDSSGHLLRKVEGTTELFHGGRPLILVRGEYKVRCCVSGASFNSVLYIYFSGLRRNFDDVTTEKRDVTEFNGQVGERRCITVDKLNIVAKHGDQEVLCRFSDKVLLDAGITVRVQKPDIVCATTGPGQLHSEVRTMCNVSAAGGLDCGSVRWFFGKENFLVKSNRQQLTEARDRYGNVSATCYGSDKFLSSTYIIQSLKSLHAASEHYFVYGEGDSMSFYAVRIPLEATASSKAAFMEPMSLMLGSFLGFLLIRNKS